MNLPPKVSILTNIMAPYRLPLYRRLAQKFELSVIYSGGEDDRDYWEQEYKQEKGYIIKRAWGFRVKIKRRKYKNLYDFWYLHVNPGYLWELVKLRPDAVITHEMGARTFMALFYGLIFSKPVWVSWEGTVHTEKNIGFIKKIARKIIVKSAKRWVSFGETSTEYLINLGVNRKRILQIQNCVNEDWFISNPGKPSINIKPAPVILYAGRLVGLKGLIYYFEAAVKVQGEGYNFSTLIVGTGPDREKLEDYAVEIGLQNIYFYPPVEPYKMSGIYKSADLLVFPTLDDVWGLVVNEALWSGVPVLCSRYAGCAKELLPQENIFNPLDEDDFYSALKRALNGYISGPDYWRLKTYNEVAEMIIDEVSGALKI